MITRAASIFRTAHFISTVGLCIPGCQGIERNEPAEGDGTSSEDSAAHQPADDGGAIEPRGALRIELSWNDGANDQDLYVAMLGDAAHTLCSDTVCSRRNCAPTAMDPAPIWSPNDPPRQGANPGLAIDDTNGQGPETVTVDQPLPGDYRAYSYYYSGSSKTVGRLRVLSGDSVVAEYSRELEIADLWSAADIHVDANGRVTVLAVPGASAGSEVGLVRRWLTPFCPSEDAPEL